MNDERRKILKMVEDGIISSEEAEELFESLDKAEQAQQSNYLSKQVDWEQGENYHSKSNSQTSNGKKAKFFDFIEEAVTKIKNVDLDFNFGPYKKISHIFHSQNIDVSTVDIDISNGSLNIMPWNEADVRIECEAKVYQVNDQDQARRRFIDDAQFSIQNDNLHFSIPSKQIKADVIVKIPNKLYDKVVVNMFNGPIDTENITAKQLCVKTKNGALKLENITSTIIITETANGMIKINHTKAKELEAETINGSIRLSGQYENVDAQVVNGSIHCAWENSDARTGFFKTTTGSVRLNLPGQTSIDGKVETKIGSIHCNLTDYKIFDEKKEMINRSLHFEANRQYEQLLHIEAETKTGSVWVLPNE